jgi:TorA maturation chaperone TorD
MQDDRGEMRDQGLESAIRTAGGVTELARRIGISQPSLSNWSRIPAERVPAVEAATNIHRTILRPDLFSEQSMVGEVDEVDATRAQEYALLSVLLARAPDADLLARLARLGRLTGDASPLGLAHIALAQAADGVSLERVEREYFDLFIGLGRGELMPYGSYYLTGFLHERPLARLRGDLGALGIERVENNFEPEDHAATLCEIMAAIAGGRFPAPAGAEKNMFDKHLAPWIGRFFADLERAETADFYRHVGAVGRVFMDIETEAFALPA